MLLDFHEMLGKNAHASNFEQAWYPLIVKLTTRA